MQLQGQIQSKYKIGCVRDEKCYLNCSKKARHAIPRLAKTAGCVGRTLKTSSFAMLHIPYTESRIGKQSSPCLARVVRGGSSRANLKILE